MSDYTQSTFFAPKDLLATGNPNKIIYGSDVDAELSAISTAIATKADVNGDAIGAGTPCTELSVDNLKLDANKIISTNTDGDIELEPDGTGIVTISSDVGIGTANPSFYEGSGAEIERAGTATLRLQNTVTAKSAEVKIDSDLILETINTGSVVKINTGATERMRIDASGNLLVGTQSNTGYGGHVFEKDGTNSNAIAIINSATSNPYGPNITFSGASPNDAVRYFLSCSDSTTQRAIIRSNGGLVNYQSNNVDLSDIRTKKDITPAPSYWDKIGALEIVTYKYKDQSHDDVNVGVIAQQVETVEPVWVDNDGFGNSPEGEEPLKTVYTKDITFAAIKALQEAMARIETLEAEVAALKGA